MIKYYKNKRIKLGHIHLNCLKPVNFIILKKLIKKYKKILTLEEHIISNGLGSIISDFLFNFKLKNIDEKISLGIPDKFPDKYGEQTDLLGYFGLEDKNIIQVVNKMLKSK